MRTALYRGMMELHFRWQFQKHGLKIPAKEAEPPRLFTGLLNGSCTAIAAFWKSFPAGYKYRLGVVSNFYGNVETLCKEFGCNIFMKVLIDSAVVGFKNRIPAFSTGAGALKTARRLKQWRLSAIPSSAT